MNITQNLLNDDDLPGEINLSGGLRGQFYQPGVTVNVPVYLETDVQAYLSAIASRKGVALSELANDLLKKDIQILKIVGAI